MFNFMKLNSPEGPAKLNLICFHWAGGSGIVWKPLSKYLESHNVVVYSVTLPGRNGRGTDTMFRRFPDMITALLPEFVKFHEEYSIGDLPMILFGHSLGGMIAYELTKAVTDADLPRVVIDRVIVSAVRCPVDLTEQNRAAVGPRRYQQADQELIEYMGSIGGIPAGVDLEIINFMMPTIKGDYEAIETYDLTHFGAPRLNTPLTLFEGGRDASMTSAMMERWSELTTEEFNKVHIAEGGHFFPTDASTSGEFNEKLLEECQKHFVQQMNMCILS